MSLSRGPVSISLLAACRGSCLGTKAGRRGYPHREREQNNCFYKGQNRKTSCGPLPCVVIDLTVVILGVSHLIDVSLSAHCNGKHFMLSASRPDLYSILWQLLPLSYSNTFGMLRNRQLLLKCSDYKQAFYPFRLSRVCAVFGKGLLPQQDNVVDTEKDTVAVFVWLSLSLWISSHYIILNIKAWCIKIW